MENNDHALLRVFNLSKNFGGVHALSNVDLEVRSGQIASLIGPNGAGKTTLFNCITGMIEPSNGEVTFENFSIVKKRPDQIVKIGMARTFQNIRLFSELSVIDNVKIGRHIKSKIHVFGAIMRTRNQRREEIEITEKAIEKLKFVGLDHLANQVSSNLSYGDQRRLEIARALATEPKLLLLDEPAAGMNPQETNALIDLIQAIRESGITVFLIEHDMKLVMKISEWITVLDHGEKISAGNPEKIQNDPKVIEAYLGKN